MDRSRWFAFGLGLVVLFFASMAAGAFIGRQVNSGQVPPVGQATASPSPLATAGMTPTPSPTASPSPSPTQPRPPPPTVPPTVPPTPALDPPTVEEFATELAAAIRGADTDYLIARLHQAVIERYGDEMCMTYVADNVAGDQVEWEILGTSGPAPWSYETDELATVIADAWTVSARQPGATPELRELHFAPLGGRWRWFTDCGELL